MNYVLRRRKLGRTSCKEIAARSKQGIQCIRNDAHLPVANPGDVIFRWGTTTTIPGSDNATVVNNAKAIHWCADKRGGRLHMQREGVLVPQTWGDVPSFMREVHKPTDKFVVRPKTHAQGRNLEVGDAAAAVVAARKFGESYISRLINKVAEYRIYVICGKIACVAKKTPGNPNDVAWNVARGGRFDNVRWDDWPLRAIEQAVKAAKIGGLDFCGVDVMTLADGTPYVLEVNSAPSLTSDYRQDCFAKAFDYIVANGKGWLDINDYNSWKSVVHPSIWWKGRKKDLEAQAQQAA